MATIEIRGMRKGERESVHQMLDRAFPHTSKSYFDRQTDNDPFLKPEDTRILLKHGRILSCVRVYFRSIYCEGETLKIGGIGDVGTDPSARGQGYAIRLLNDAIEYMRKKNAVLSILFTRINPFYHRVGYFTIPTIDLDIPIPSPTKIIAYDKADMNRDLSGLAQLYYTFNHQRIGPVCRTESYWKKQPYFPRVDPDLFWVIEKNSQIICYVRGSVRDDTLKIQEFCYGRGNERAVLDLIATMAHSLDKKNARISYLSEKETDIFSIWSPERSENTALMVRLIQLNKLSIFQKLLKHYRILFWEADRF